MKNKPSYRKELWPIWGNELKSWVGWGNFRQFLKYFLITTASLILLYHFGKIDIVEDELWNILAIFVIWVVVYLPLIIGSSFITANQKLFSKQDENIKKLESIINKPVSIYASTDQDEISGTHIFKQIMLVNQSPQDLLSCVAIIEAFYELLPDESKRKIAPKSYQISWATTGRRTPDNTVNLKNGIPERAYIARIDTSINASYLVGEKGNYTPLEKKGKYLVQIKLYGDNLPQHIFNVCFDYDGSGSIDITEVSKPSPLLFFYENIRIHNKITPVAIYKRKCRFSLKKPKNRDNS